MKNKLYPYLKLVWLLSCLFSSKSAAVELRHQINERDNQLSLMTARACRGFEVSTSRILCLPESNVFNPAGSLQSSILLKMDQDALETLQKAYAEDFDEAFIDQLFKEDNFLDVSGLFRISVLWANLDFSFTPIQFQGAYKLSNPALPELDLAILRQSLLSLTSKFLWVLPGRKTGEFFMSLGVHSYDREFVNIQTDILTNSANSVSNQTKNEVNRGIYGSANFAFFSRRAWIPSLSLGFERIGNRVACQACGEQLIDLRGNLQPEVSLTASSYVNLPFGKMIYGGRLPYRLGADNDQEGQEASGFLGYHLSHFLVTGQLSPYSWGFGFLFRPSHYEFGLSYTSEKQDNQFKTARTRQSYVYTTFNL